MELEKLCNFRTPAQQRLIFEEFFSVGAGLALKRRKAKSVAGIEFQVKASAHQAIRKILPFHPTNAQKRVLREIVDDMCSARPMNRLLQGDVGSGKTIVAIQAATQATLGSSMESEGTTSSWSSQILRFEGLFSNTMANAPP